MRTRETVLVFSAVNATEPSSGSIWNVIFTRGLSLIVIPVSRTSMIVPTPRAPLAIRSSALAFLLRNMIVAPPQSPVVWANSIRLGDGDQKARVSSVNRGAARSDPRPAGSARARACGGGLPRRAHRPAVGTRLRRGRGADARGLRLHRLGGAGVRVRARAARVGHPDARARGGALAGPVVIRVGGRRALPAD